MALKNAHDLRKVILKKAQRGINEDMLDVVKGMMIKATEDKVYAVYDPTEYVRRHYREGYGLDDRRNIHGWTSYENSYGFEYRVANFTRPDVDAYGFNDYLTPLIVMGQREAIAQGYPVRYHRGAERYPYGKERDFITETKNIMNNNRRSLIRDLETFMKK